ncbi:hypothetical protein FOL46_002881, partial [Perkinsus olseni]
EAGITTNHAVDDTNPTASSKSGGRRGYHKSKKICYQYQKYGSCKYGDRCRFVHSKKPGTDVGQSSADKDTGAYFNYVREDQAKLLGLKIEPGNGDIKSGVRLEFFQKDNSRGVHISIKDHIGLSQPSVGNDSTDDDKELSEPPSIDHVGSILGTVEDQFDLSDTVDTTLHDDSWGSIPWTPKPLESSEVSETSWHFMRDAPGFRWQIRKLESSDIADTSTQEYKFVIDLPKSNGPTGRTYDYTKPMFANLSRFEMDAYNTEIS